MANLETRIQNDLVEAMKLQDDIRLTVLREIKTSITEKKTASVGAIKNPTDDDIINIIRKLVKEHLDTQKMASDAGRLALQEQETLYIDILNQYLPKAATFEEIDEFVTNYIASENLTPTIKDMGKIIGATKAHFGAIADGSLIAKVVKSKISQ